MVNRCVCRAISFAEILSLANGEKDLNKVREIVPCADKCKMCEIYLKKALLTNQTELELI